MQDVVKTASFLLVVSSVLWLVLDVCGAMSVGMLSWVANKVCLVLVVVVVDMLLNVWLLVKCSSSVAQTNQLPAVHAA
jgi:hypothetical protein